MSGKMSNIYTDKELLDIANKEIATLTPEQLKIADYL